MKKNQEKSKETKSNKLIEKIENHRGREIEQYIRELSIDQYMLNRNLLDLMKCIKYYKDNKELMATKNRDKLDAFLGEFIRVLHNYLASVNTLRNHIYATANKLENDFKERYSSELEERDIKKIGSFLIEMGNFIRHKKLLPVASTFSYSKGEGTERSLTLNKKRLLEEYDLNEDAKEYLEDWEKRVNIPEVLVEYHKEAKFLCNWFKSEIYSDFSKEIDEHNQLIREFNCKLKK
ncbi:MAG: hypothetical protein ACOCTT_03040 [archaeon]